MWIKFVQGTLSTDNSTFYAHTEYKMRIKYTYEKMEDESPITNNSGVYLLECIYAHGTYVKIGLSEDVRSRFMAIESGNPFVTCVGYINTNKYKKLEKQLHQQFDKFRVKGEWFTADDSIYDYFKTHPEFKQL